jgi:hypothetical protein
MVFEKTPASNHNAGLRCNFYGIGNGDWNATFDGLQALLLKSPLYVELQEHRMICVRQRQLMRKRPLLPPRGGDKHRPDTQAGAEIAEENTNPRDFAPPTLGPQRSGPGAAMRQLSGA